MEQHSPYLLIADDDEDDRMVFGNEFRQRTGIPVEYASSGRGLFELLAGRPADRLPGVLLMDYKMHDYTGQEILRELAAVRKYEKMIKVIWSTSRIPREKAFCLALGATDYLVKPASNAELDAIVACIARHFNPQGSILPAQAKYSAYGTAQNAP